MVLLLWFCFATPESWIEAFFSPLTFRALQAEPVRPREPLFIMPVPVIESDMPPPSEAERKPEEEFPETWRPEFAWWNAAWQLHIQQETARLLVPEQADSIASSLFESATVSVLLRKAERDTSFAVLMALYEMRLRERYEELKPYWETVTRSRQYREILNTGARLFDEFLLEEISVPNPDDDED